MKIFLAILALTPGIAMAGSSGHMSCKVTVGKKNIEFIYGILNNSGDATLKVDGKEKEMSADIRYIRADSFIQGKDSRNAETIYIATSEATGEDFVQLVEVQPDDKTSYLLTVNTDGVAFFNKSVTCNTTN